MTVVYRGHANRVTSPVEPPPPDPDPEPGTFVPGSDAPGADAEYGRMYGGEHSSKPVPGEATTDKSWINRPIPDDAVRDTDNEEQAIADIIASVFTFAPGTDPNDTTIYPSGGGPSWGPLVSRPTFNHTKFSCTINFIDSANTPLQRVEIVGPKRTSSSQMATNAMAWAGFPIPAGLQPTDDPDGTLCLIDLNTTWPGDPTNQAYWGTQWEIWGAKSPEQNIAEGNISPTTGLLQTGWTAKTVGRKRGALTDVKARPKTRTGGDAADTSVESYGAPAVPWNPILATEPDKVHWGYGPDGVAESSNWLTSAAHIPFSHTILTKRDILAGQIRHAMGFMLFTMYPAELRNKGFVWPATGYDSSSRPYLKHGNLFAFMPGDEPIYPAAMPTEWRWLFDLFFYCIRDYGMRHMDTTGNSFAMRGEPGIRDLTPANINWTQFIQYLFQAVRDGQQEMRMILPGSDSVFYPAPPPDESLPTLPEPAAGTVLASGGNIKSAIAGLTAGQTLYLEPGGTYTLTSTTTVTAEGVKIATQPGGPNATITGNQQFRIYADNVELWRLNFDQGYVAGKQIEVSGTGCAMVDCDFTNNFNTAAPSSTNAGALILFTTDGPSGVCADFLMYGCHFHQVGKVGSGFDHALYLKELDGGVFHSNTAFEIHGGWFFHCYPNTKHLTITRNYLESGCFVTCWQDVAGAVISNQITYNAWHNDFTGLNKPPVQGNTGALQGNLYDHNAGLQEYTSQGGSDGTDTDYTVSFNLVADPQFADPANGDFTIGNATVAAHLAS